MAYYVRLVWGMARGYPDNPVVGAPHWLGLHFEPVLFIPALLSRAGLPVAELLLVLQAALSSLALIPMWRLARRRLLPALGAGGSRRGELLALAAASIIYLVPAVSRCLDYDVHPSTMALLPLCAWIDAVDGGAQQPARVAFSRFWLVLALCFREDIGLQVAAAASAFALRPTAGDEAARRAQRREMVIQGLFGLGWFLAYALLLQPRFLPDPSSGSFGAHFERWGGGHGGVGGVLAAALSQPGALLSHLLADGRPLYLPALLSVVGFVALASPHWLLGMLPILGINMLSDFPGVRRVESHYATAMMPFLSAAAVLGAARLARLLGARPAWLRAAPLSLSLTCAAFAFWTRGAAPGAPDFTLTAYRDDGFARASREQVAALAGAPRVVAEPRLLAHLAERPEPLLDPALRRYWKR